MWKLVGVTVISYSGWMSITFRLSLELNIWIIKCLCTKNLSHVHHAAEMGGVGWYRWGLYGFSGTMHMLNASKIDKEGKKTDREGTRKPRTAGEALKCGDFGVATQYTK